MHVDGDLGGGDLSDLAVSALELLQWKEVEGAAALVAPLHTLLSALLPRLGSIAAPHGGDAADEDASGDEQEGRAGGAAAAAGSAAAGYASQLALLALRRLAPGGDAAAAVVARGALPEGFDVTLVLAVLAAAPDAALRNAALGLLESLARGAPEAMLGHVLEVGRGFRLVCAVPRCAVLRCAVSHRPVLRRAVSICAVLHTSAVCAFVHACM
jgi:hypothetical protein